MEKIDKITSYIGAGFTIFGLALIFLQWDLTNGLLALIVGELIDLPQRIRNKNVAKKALLCYEFQTKNTAGTGAIDLTIKNEYTEKDFHTSRKIVAEKIRKQLKLGINDQVKVVITNLIKLPL